MGKSRKRKRVQLNGKGILIRRAQDKLRRRVRQLVGRPDNSPWVFDPRPARHTADVDFVFALDYCSPNSRLMKLFHEAMSGYGLSCQLVNNTNVERMTRTKTCCPFPTGCCWISPSMVARTISGER